MAVFAFAWAVARARIQSITLDEAGSYFVTVNMRSVEWLWHPAASNHLLNTLMMELFTSVFGPSPLSVRAGALIGAAIYIVVAYWLCRMLSREWIIRLPLFACLVYNPYVFDFFVAARGYGLALAFLLTAIAVAAWSHVRQCQAIGCAFASLCIGLSFTANFSFAFADCALLLMIFLWAAISSPRPDSRRSWFLFVPCAIPALVVVFLIPSSTLLDWRKGELTWGSESMSKTIVSMIEATLDQLNPYVVNPFLYRLADGIKPLLIPAFLIAIALQLAMAWSNRRKLHEEDRWRAGLTMITGGAAVLALSVHWLAFRILHLPLPLDRTAIFFAPLFTVMAGSAASISFVSGKGIWIRRSAISMLCVMGAYFMLSLRLTYFHEWRFGAEAKQAYDAAAYFNHTRCAERVFRSWYYDMAFEFYRVTNPRDRFSSYYYGEGFPVDRQLYVLNSVHDADFIRDQKLTMVYHGDTTEVGVYLASEVATPPKQICDAALLPEHPLP